MLIYSKELKEYKESIIYNVIDTYGSEILEAENMRISKCSLAFDTIIKLYNGIPLQDYEKFLLEECDLVIIPLQNIWNIIKLAILRITMDYIESIRDEYDSILLVSANINTTTEFRKYWRKKALEYHKYHMELLKYKDLINNINVPNFEDECLKTKFISPKNILKKMKVKKKPNY